MLLLLYGDLTLPNIVDTTSANIGKASILLFLTSRNVALPTQTLLLLPGNSRGVISIEDPTKGIIEEDLITNLVFCRAALLHDGCKVCALVLI